MQLCSVRYKKHPDIKGKLLVDDETKMIIEKSFLAYQGYGSAKSQSS